MNNYEKKILIIGLGSIGERHVRNLLSLNYNNIACLRREISTARTFDISNITQFDSREEAVEWSPEYVIICSPSKNHNSDLIFWSEHCKNFLVEVPLHSSAEEIENSKDLLKKRGAKILLGHNIRFHPALKKMKEIIKSKIYGKLLFIKSEFGEYLPDCHPWEDYRTRYEARSDLGGGVLLTSLHELDHSMFLAGKYIDASGLTDTLGLDIDCEDFATIIAKHKSGVVSQISLDFIQRDYQRSTKLCFENGIVYWELKKKSLYAFDSNDKKIGWKNILNLENYDFNQTYIDQIVYFLDEDFCNFNSLEDGLHILKLIKKIKDQNN